MTSDSVWDKLRIVFALAVMLFVLTASPSFADTEYATVESGNIKVSVPTEIPTYVRADGSVLTAHANIKNEGTEDVSVSVADVTSSYPSVSLDVSTRLDAGDWFDWFTYSSDPDGGLDRHNGPKRLAPGASMETQWDVGQLNDEQNADLLKAAANGGAALATVTFGLAAPQPQDYAVFSADDSTLRLYHRDPIPTGATTFNGHDVTKVFRNIGKSPKEDAPFLSYSQRIQTVDIVDEGIRPSSTSQWFSRMTSLTSIDHLDRLDTSRDVNMRGMFLGCSGLTALDLSHMDTSKVKDVSHMFEDCSGLSGLNLSNFKTSNVEHMKSMFLNCSGLSGLDLSNFDTSKVTDMYAMFEGCSGLSRLNLASFDVSDATDTSFMFDSCGTDDLVITIGGGWRIRSFPSMDSPDVFYDCDGRSYASGAIDPAANTVYYRKNPAKAEDAAITPSSDIAADESPAIDPQAGSSTHDGADVQSTEDESDTRCGEPTVDDAQTTDDSTSP